MKSLLLAASAVALSFTPLSASAFDHACGQSAMQDIVSTHGADTISIGDLHVFNRRAFETPPNARNAGGFFSLYNYADAPNRLISASSPVAERVELHTMTMDNDVMRMRELDNGIEVPSETQIDLEPGGMHVMFLNLTQPFTEGEEVPVTLVFEGGESREITLPVRVRTMNMGGGHGAGHGETN